MGTGILRQWATEDFEAASQWVNQLPPGSFQQVATAELEKVAASPQRGSYLY
ncbi:MAG TPA: hypothetical protein VMA13_06045 [Candidatus Saccharimonadales bacterium]|nr:hypothetical protein [Candidatus Saccharimonadales bacterium]